MISDARMMTYAERVCRCPDEVVEAHMDWERGVFIMRVPLPDKRMNQNRAPGHRLACIKPKRLLQHSTSAAQTLAGLTRSGHLDPWPRSEGRMLLVFLRRQRRDGGNWAPALKVVQDMMTPTDDLPNGARGGKTKGAGLIEDDSSEHHQEWPTLIALSRACGLTPGLYYVIRRTPRPRRARPKPIQDPAPC